MKEEAGMKTVKRNGLVAGVDEAGRGPLAGPVVAAAVILGRQPPAGLADSKQLSASRRTQLYDIITSNCLAVAFWIVSPRKIDDLNVLQATFRAMRGAVAALTYEPDIVHVDGNKTIPGLRLPQRALVGGDRRCPAVAAASIVAKVVRDRTMTLWDKVYPEYGFDGHKGYGTVVHTDALARHGPCAIHRYSFAPVRDRGLFTAFP